MPINAHAFVRNLTHVWRIRRESVAHAALFTLALMSSLTLSLPAGAAVGAQWHSTADIAAVAEAFLLERLGKTDGDTTVRAGMLDERLKLTACDKPLVSFLRPGAKIGSKTIVGVRCDGSKPWKMYVPVEISVRTQVWVARQPLPRGHLLGRKDLVADTRDVARMTAGYISDPDRLIGQRLRSSVLAGRVLTLKLLEPNSVIARGQTVTLTVANASLSIRMTGKALMDGALNQRIRVENLASGRVVEGIVRSREIVEILVPESGDSAQPNPKVSAPLADIHSSNNDR